MTTKETKAGESHAYLMGYDAAVNGANGKNCNFAIFNTPENTKEWERGNKDGLESLTH